MTEPDLSIESAIECIDTVEKTINELAIFTRRLDIYPFDTVAGEMLAKGIALARSAILLIQQGYPDEAFGICRSLYECCIYLRYITGERDQLEERSMAFIEFGVKSKAFWFHLLDKGSSLSQEERQDIERYKLDNNIPDDPKVITRPWSGIYQIVEKISKKSHPLDADDSTEALRDKQRAIAYTDTSSYVHCTQPGVNSYSYGWKEPILVKKAQNAQTATAVKTFMVIHVHLRELLRYCLFGMNVVSLAELKYRESVDTQITGDAAES
jgi:hypothetical protein